MPWSVPVDQRLQFAKAVMGGGQYSFTELCERSHVSRKTGYKWAWRYVEEGESRSALLDRRRGPDHVPHKTNPEVVAKLVATRKRFPDWGARKILRLLSEQGEKDLPAPSTVTEILQREKLVRVRRRRRPRPPTERDHTIARVPNDVWTVDFKGQFPTRDGVLCYPLTIVDDFSRYLLALRGLPSIRQPGVFAVMEETFREFGLPIVIRTDNGAPFASTGLARLSKLSVWWIKLGIRVERITPGRPTENGRHERVHRTLKSRCLRPKPAENAERQQLRFDAFTLEYNTLRPHESLEMRTPATLYTPSPRRFPDKLEVVYPGHFHLRKVGGNGSVRWHTATLFLTDALIGETIGIHEIDDGLWSVQFADVELGRWSDRDHYLYTGGAMGPCRLNREDKDT